MKLSCREIYRFSPDVFGKLETEGAIEAADFMEKNSLILALGGGTVENRPAMAILKKKAVLIYLEDLQENLLKRILRRGIPSFLDQDDPEGSFSVLFKRRTALYRTDAEIVVPVNEASIDEALDMLEKKILN